MLIQCISEQTTFLRRRLNRISLSPEGKTGKSEEEHFVVTIFVTL